MDDDVNDDQAVPFLDEIEELDDEQAEAAAEEAQRLARDENIIRMAEGYYDQLQAREQAREWFRNDTYRDAPRPVAESINDLLLSDYEDKWLIPGFIPWDGKFLIASAAKGGKTTCVTNVVHSLVTMRPFLQRFAVHADYPLKVAVLDNEMSPGLLKDWYGRLNLPEEAQKRVDIFRLLGHAQSFDPTLPENRAIWAPILAKYDVAIIDCLSPFMVAVGLDENNEAGKWLEGIDALMAEAGISCYGVVHHTGHEGERARGDSRILGWATQTISLVVEGNGPDDPNPIRFIKALSGRGEPVPLGLLNFDKDTGLLTYTGGVTRKKAKDTRSAVQKRWDAQVPKLHAEYGYEKWFTIKDAEFVCGLTGPSLREMLDYGATLDRVKKRKKEGRDGGGGFTYRLRPPIEVT